jgi:16S rRNA (guanine966-N2)-methyltransferase
VRIISGKWKGRQLVSFKANHIRPTTDRVKETLFNILQHDIPDSRILDLFGGTGNLSFESLSRGARFVELVESHKISLKIIQENMTKLGVTRQDLSVRPMDVFQYLKKYTGDPFDLAFIDPPFTEKLAHEVMEAIAKSKVLRVGGLAIIEAGGQERIDDKYNEFVLLDRREYGDKTASIFRRENPRVIE